MADRITVAAATAGLAGLLLGVGGYAFADRQGSEAAVRKVLLDHPEIIAEAGEQLHQKQVGALVDQHRAALETPFAGAWAGNANGDVTLVEFYDYACGYCRAANADVDRLLAEDRGLKVVYRELPVLGPDSVTAAHASLAAARAGRFKPFYDALFAAGRPSPETIRAAQATARLPAAAPDPAGHQELQRNMELAAALGASGTPLFVVGDRIFPGAVGYDTLKAAIEAAREG